MTKPRILDLFCGAGGAARGYADAGFEVVGVDLHPQPNYPYEFHRADALEYLSELLHWEYPVASFDAIHASPPCQHYSRKTRDKSKHPDLVPRVRALLEQAELPYVIENVEGAPLLEPVTLCGSMFGLRVRRHRLFETNWLLLGPSCNHAWQDDDKRFLLYDHGRWFWSGIVHVFGLGGGKGKDYWPHAMGCGESWSDCWMTPKELAEAIPPAYAEYVGKQLFAYSTNRLNAVAA